MAVNIAMLTAGLTYKAGGVLSVAEKLAYALQQGHSCNVTLLGREYHDTMEVSARASVPMKAFPPLGPKAFGYGRGMAEGLAGLQPDIVHVHGCWLYPSIAGNRQAMRSRGPCIVSPHGMLDPWALSNARLKKWLVSMLYERKCLNEASCIHALNVAEAQAIRDFGLQNPICVIPNGVHIPNAKGVIRPAWREALPDKSRVLLYFGRLHPKKGLAELITAWKLVSRDADNWHLVIAGWGDKTYEEQLRTEVENHSDGNVHLIGPQYGDDIGQMYSASDALILPSFSEGLPMVVLEAWAHCLPVLMTLQCNLPEGFAAQSAIRIETDLPLLQHALCSLFTTSKDDLGRLGENGLHLVERQYTWDTVSRQMKEVYDWMLGGGQVPDTIILD